MLQIVAPDCRQLGGDVFLLLLIEFALHREGGVEVTPPLLNPRSTLRRPALVRWERLWFPATMEEVCHTACCYASR